MIDTDSAGKCGLRNDVGDVLDSASNAEVVKQVSISDGAVMDDEVEKNAISPKCDLARGVHEESGELAVTVTIGKYGAISSLSHIWMTQAQCQSPELSFDNILAYPEACEALSKGFLVKKFQRKQLNRESCTGLFHREDCNQVFLVSLEYLFCKINISLNSVIL